MHPGTASRALNPALPGRVTADTRRRVQRRARDLGYTPDPAARSLRTRRSGFVGVVVPDLTNPVIPPIVRGIEEQLWRSGLACLLADTDNDVEREAAVIAELQARRCEGLIVATATRSSATVAGLAREDATPTVLVTRDIDARSLPLVAADDAAGVDAAVHHLAALGHERLAHLTGPPELSTTVTRLRAFRRAVAALELPEPRVLHGEAFTTAAGERATARLLRERRDVTAIVAGNDMIALGCYTALADAGLRCPDDVSVVGHNDMPLVASLQPPLTTVAIPQHAIGSAAAAMLLERLEDGVETDPVEHRLLPTALVVRGSTAPPP